MNEIERLTNLLRQTFDGNPWFGEPLLVKLESVDFEQANCVPAGAKKSVAELVMHIISWRIFTIKKLEMNEPFMIEMNSKGDWPDVSVNSASAWKTVLDELISTQKKLLNLTMGLSTDDLDKTVLGKPYTFRYLMEGIIQHDVYHLGQIGLTLSLIQNQGEEVNE